MARCAALQRNEEDRQADVGLNEQRWRRQRDFVAGAGAATGEAKPVASAASAGSGRKFRKSTPMQQVALFSACAADR